MKGSPGAATAGGMCLASALLWARALSTGAGPWDPFQLVVLTAGIVVLATAALVGMVVKGSRWGRRIRRIGVCNAKLRLTHWVRRVCVGCHCIAWPVLNLRIGKL